MRRGRWGAKTVTFAADFYTLLNLSIHSGRMRDSPDAADGTTDALWILQVLVAVFGPRAMTTNINVFMETM